MSRFGTHSWPEILLRPIAMTSPEGGVYVEFQAPDFRLAWAVLLMLVYAIVAWRRPSSRRPALLALAALMVAWFLVWMLTTGNGRYFVPGLLLCGPLCIGLVHHLPATRRFRGLLTALFLAWQSYLLMEVPFTGVWTRTEWKEAPAFQLELPAEYEDQAATYVSVSALSYAIAAPLFHPDSRWMNVSSMQGTIPGSLESVRVTEFLERAGPLRLVFYSVTPYLQRPPATELVRAVDSLLARYGLAIAAVEQCRFLHSPSLSRRASIHNDATPVPELGLWICPGQRVAPPPPAAVDAARPRVDAVFERLEQLCPANLGKGQARTLPVADGSVRHYADADTRVYVMNDGRVLSKYYRSLNAETLGTVATVMSDTPGVDCDRIKRRRVLPWQRGI